MLRGGCCCVHGVRYYNQRYHFVPLVVLLAVAALVGLVVAWGRYTG